MKEKQKTFGVVTIISVVIFVLFIIADYIINKQLTFSKISSISIPLILILVLAGIGANKNKVFYVLATFSVVIIPYLLVLNYFLKGSWFSSLALPLAIIVIASLWVTYISIRQRDKIGLIMLIAILFFIYGVVFDFSIQWFVTSYLKRSFFDLSTVIRLISSTTIALLLFVIAYLLKKKGRTEELLEETKKTLQMKTDEMTETTLVSEKVSADSKEDTADQEEEMLTEEE